MTSCPERPYWNLPNTRSTTLKADKAYIDLLEAESTWAMKYVFSNTNPLEPRQHPIMGLNAPNTGGCQMKQYNSMLPRNFRMQTRASQNRLHTELFGTAPYMALGRGVLKHVDVSTMLQQGNWVPEGPSRTLMESKWDRNQFVTIPKELKQLKPELRYGSMTRVGPSYMQPHDP